MDHKNFKIYPQKSGGFIISYIHPFSKLRVREAFKSLDDATIRQRELQEHNHGSSIEDLMKMFHKATPKHRLFKSKRILTDFVSMFSHFELTELTTEALKAWFYQLKLENDYTNTTMLKIKSDLNQFFKFLINLKLINNSPLDGINYKKSITPKRIYLTQEEIDLIITTAKEVSPGYFYPIILTCWETLITVSELINLRWNQVDLINQTITISPTRIIKISDELSGIIKKIIKTDQTVFKNIQGKSFTTKKLAFLLKDFKKIYSIEKNWHFMDFRHSYAKIHLEQNKSMKELQLKLGHKELKNTKELYRNLETDLKI